MLRTSAFGRRAPEKCGAGALARVRREAAIFSSIGHRRSIEEGRLRLPTRPRVPPKIGINGRATSLAATRSLPNPMARNKFDIYASRIEHAKEKA